MKTLSDKPTGERGSILMISLCVGTVIAIVLATYLLMLHNQHLSVARSQGWNMAIALAEAGVEETLAHLNFGVTETPPDPGADSWGPPSGGLYHTPANRSLLGGSYGVAFTVSTNPIIYSTGYVRAPITGQLISRAVEAKTGNGSPFLVAIAAKTTIVLKGNKIAIDSYDSSDPAWSTNGRYDPSKSRDHGDVATTSITNDQFSAGNADIKGKIRTGPSGQPSIGPQGSVGDSAWVDGGNNGIKPGWWTDDMNQEFADVLPPFTSALPPPYTNQGSRTTYVLGSGNYMMNGALTLQNNDTVYVADGQNAVLYVTGDLTMQGNSSIVIGDYANLKIYVGGASATLTSVNTTTTANANTFSYLGLPSNKSLVWGGNAEYVGTVYAPSAAFEVGGGGKDDLDYQGACVVNSIIMNGQFNFHFDENLTRKPPYSTLVISSWREL